MKLIIIFIFLPMIFIACNCESNDARLNFKKVPIRDFETRKNLWKPYRNILPPAGSIEEMRGIIEKWEKHVDSKTIVASGSHFVFANKWYPRIILQANYSLPILIGELRKNNTTQWAFLLVTDEIFSTKIKANLEWMDKFNPNAGRIVEWWDGNKDYLFWSEKNKYFLLSKEE